MTKTPPRETDKDKLLEILSQPASTLHVIASHEKAKAELLVACIEDLIKSIDKNSDTSHTLATRIFWLNLVLTSATVIGTIVAILSLFYR